jgi:hypothetical protein
MVLIEKDLPLHGYIGVPCALFLKIGQYPVPAPVPQVLLIQLPQADPSRL